MPFQCLLQLVTCLIRAWRNIYIYDIQHATTELLFNKSAAGTAVHLPKTQLTLYKITRMLGSGSAGMLRLVDWLITHRATPNKRLFPTFREKKYIEHF
jgi:hypothetical protein